jgi:hypothetical protein
MRSLLDAIGLLLPKPAAVVEDSVSGEVVGTRIVSINLQPAAAVASTR